MTLWLHMSPIDFLTTKCKIFRFPKAKKFHLDHHRQPINMISKSFLLWYSTAMHPHAADKHEEALHLNKAIRHQFFSDPSECSNEVECHPDWSPATTFPTISLAKCTPECPHTPHFTTTAQAVQGPTFYAKMIKASVNDVEVSRG